MAVEGRSYSAVGPEQITQSPKLLVLFLSLQDLRGFSRHVGNGGGVGREHRSGMRGRRAVRSKLKILPKLAHKFSPIFRFFSDSSMV